MHDGMNGFFGMGFGWFWWLLIIILVVIVVLVLVNRSNRNRDIHGNTGSKDNALDILEKRYANGEIDTQEYRQRKRELTE